MYADHFIDYEHNDHITQTWSDKHCTTIYFFFIQILILMQSNKKVHAYGYAKYATHKC